MAYMYESVALNPIVLQAQLVKIVINLALRM